MWSWAGALGGGFVAKKYAIALIMSTALFFTILLFTQTKQGMVPHSLNIKLRVFCWPSAVCVWGTIWCRLNPLLRYGILLAISHMRIKHFLVWILICSTHKSAFYDAPTSEISLFHLHYNIKWKTIQATIRKIPIRGQATHNNRYTASIRRRTTGLAVMLRPP